MYDEKFMRLAILQSEKCKKSKDVPVGCVIVRDKQIISVAHNKKEAKKSSLAHAEILAIKKANKKLKNENLTGCEMYVTFEPCLMCAGAIIGARIKYVYFGAYDNRFSTVKELSQFTTNHHTNFYGGYLKDECSNLLTRFFKEIRANDRNDDGSKAKDKKY